MNHGLQQDNALLNKIYQMFKQPKNVKPAGRTIEIFVEQRQSLCHPNDNLFFSL